MKVNNMLNLATPRKSGWYNGTWINYVPEIHADSNCKTCGNKNNTDGKYSIMKNYGKGQEYVDFCCLEHAQEYVNSLPKEK